MPQLARPIVRWLLRLVAALALLLLLLLASSPWSVPALLRRELPRLAQQQIGRVLKVGAIDFNPLLLRLRLHDLALRDASGRADALRLAQGSVRLGWSSLWQLHPHLLSIRLQGLQLRVVRDAAGQLDFEDILRRLQRRPPSPSGATPVFAVDELELRDGSLSYTDLGSGLHSRLRNLHLDLHHLSTLAGGAGALQASASAVLDGAPLRLQLAGTVFGPHPLLRAQLTLQRLPLAPWSALQPASLPARLSGGWLSASVHLQWALRETAGPQLGGEVRLQQLQLQHAAQPLLDVARIDVPVDSLQPLQRRLSLGVVRIDGVRARLQRSMLQALAAPQPAAPARRQPTASASAPAFVAAATRAAASSAPPAPATASPPGAGRERAAAAATSPGWQLRLGGLRMQDAQLRWQDATVSPAVDWELGIPRLQVGAAAWPLAGEVQASATLQGPHGLQLRLQGHASAAGDDAQVQLQGLDPRLARPYAAALLHGGALPTGTLDARLDLRWTAPTLRIDIADAQWQGFSWQPGTAAAGSGPRASRIVLRQARVDWTRSQPPRISVGELDVQQPASGPGSGVRAADVQLQHASIDLQSHVVQLGMLQVLRPQASLARDSSGRWSFAQLLPAGLLGKAAAPAVRPAAPAGPARASGKPWSVVLDHAQVRGGSAYLSDTYPAQPVVLAFSGIDADLRHAQWPMRGAAAFSLQARIRDARQAPAAQGRAPTGGLLRLQGQLQAAPWRVRATLHAQALPAQVVANYLPPVNARLLRASASADGQLDLGLTKGGPAVSFAGTVGLGDVAVDTVHPDSSLFGWRSLQLQQLRLRMRPQATPATRLDIGQVVLHDFHARLALSRQARLNVAEILHPGAAAPAPGGSTPGTAAAPPSRRAGGKPGGMQVRIGGITLDGGRIDWSDHFVQPNYSASLTKVQGHIGGFASDSPRQAEVDLRGIAEGTAPVAVAGKVNPLLSPPQLNLHGRVDDLQLAPLTPYSVHYAGYGIERGLLSMDVHYDIDPGGRLQADNRLILRQLTFGPQVPSPSATKLPVLLAVSLLKDRNGNIHLDIPISGSLRDPEFNLGSVIAEAVGKLLLRAVTAPFSLMAHVFQGKAPPPRLNVVDFPAGSARLQAAERPKLADIATLLKAKPQLVVTITGQVCGASEALAYRQQVLERRLLAQWKSNAPRAELYAHAKATQVPASAREQALAALYRSTALPDKPHDVLGLARSVPGATMERLLLQSIPDGNSYLQALAMRRAVALRDALNDLGVPALRQFIAAPLLLDASHKDCQPSARLSVSLP